MQRTIASMKNFPWSPVQLICPYDCAVFGELAMYFPEMPSRWFHLSAVFFNDQSQRPLIMDAIAGLDLLDEDLS